MKKIFLLIVFILLLSSLYADEDNAVVLHFGLGFEINTMGIGITSANSIVFKHGDIGFGGSGGVNLWKIFNLGYVMPFYWNFYTSYEYPRWFGIFFAYGWYKTGYSYLDTINYSNTAEVDRFYYMFGLQKTIYTSYYQSRWTYTRGSYIGDPSTWRAGYWRAPGTYYFSMNIQIGIRYDLVGSIEYSSSFPPIDIPQLISSVEKDDNKIKFFFGIKANYDFSINIARKTRKK